METNYSNDALSDKSGNSNQKKVYQTPKIQRFGSLAELVQHSPGVGPDGEVIFIDCTSV